MMMARKVTLLAMVVTAYVTCVSSECVDGNCTEPERPPSVRIVINPFPFSLFGPIEMDNNQNQLDVAIHRNEPQANLSEPHVLSIRVIEDLPADGGKNSVIQSKSTTAGYPSEEDFEDLAAQVRNRPFSHMLGIVDFSDSIFTGDELRVQLKANQILGEKRVTSLTLSNSRINGLSASTLEPIKNTLQELKMDNCTVNLDALINLNNLKVLNLSNTGLSSFQWFFNMRKSLKVLDLSHNQFEEVRPEITMLTHLTELYLSHNKISEVNYLPITLLPKLQVLSLTMNSITKASFTGLKNLQQLDVDWNYFWRYGHELRLPNHRMSVKLASNPWHCDCGLLQAKEDHNILDIDQLQCADRQTFAACEGCQRYFLPINDGIFVSNMTKDKIEHLGCKGLKDQFYFFRSAWKKMCELDPEKSFARMMMCFGSLVLFLTAIALCQRQSVIKKKLSRQSWLKVQKIPYLKVDNLTQPEKVPYIQI